MTSREYRIVFFIAIEFTIIAWDGSEEIFKRQFKTHEKKPKHASSRVQRHMEIKNKKVK